MHLDRLAARLPWWTFVVASLAALCVAGATDPRIPTWDRYATATSIMGVGLGGLLLDLLRIRPRSRRQRVTDEERVADEVRIGLRRDLIGRALGVLVAALPKISAYIIGGAVLFESPSDLDTMARGAWLAVGAGLYMAGLSWFHERSKPTL